MEYKILAHLLPELQSGLDHLNKMALKLGTPEIKLVELARTTEMRWNSKTGLNYYVTLVTIDVAGIAPKLAGWDLLGSIEHDPQSENNLVNGYHGQQLPKEYRSAEPKCDHCGKARRRNTTYIVRNEQGETKQIGSACLKDFTGHANPEALAAWIASVDETLETGSSSEEDEYGFCGGGSSWGIEPVKYLALVVRVCREHGYTSNANEMPGRLSTQTLVDNIILGKQTVTLTEDETNEAKIILEYGKTLVTSDQDYQYNCGVIANKEIWHGRDLGLAASLYQAYHREEARQVEIAARRANSTSTFQGEIGGKLANIEATCTHHQIIDSQYGTTHLYKFIDMDGNVYAWFSSNRITALAIGDQMKLVKGTVKDHNEFRGEKQTLITRCKVEILADGQYWKPEEILDRPQA